MTKKVCECGYEKVGKALDIQGEIYAPWVKGGNWNDRLEFADDIFFSTSTEDAIKYIKNNKLNITIWEVQGRYIVTLVS